MVVYLLGNVTLAVTAIPGTTGTTAGGAPSPWGAVLGLILLAIGTGGIKPCVASFGAEQLGSPALVQAGGGLPCDAAPHPSGGDSAR